MTQQEMMAFFEERQIAENARAEITAELREGLEAFSSSHGCDKKAVKMAYQLYKTLQKDRKEAESTQFEYDKLAELLIVGAA